MQRFSFQFSLLHTFYSSSRLIAGRGCKVVGGALLVVLHKSLHLCSGDRVVSFDKGMLFRMSYFSVKVYHQGSFGLQGGPLKYLGGETTVIDYCNEDEWSLIEVYNIVSRQGYLKKDIAVMWYKSQDQSTEEGLRMLRTDKDAMDMANIGVREDMVELYVVHKTSDIHEKVEDVHMLGSTETTMQVKAGGSDGPGPMVTFEAHAVGQVEINPGPNVEEKIVGKKDGTDESDEEEEGSDGSEDEDYEPKGGEDDSSDSWIYDSKNGYCSEDSAVEVVFGDSDNDKEGVEDLVDVNIKVWDRFETASTETQTDTAKESRSDKGKEKIVAGLGDEEEGYESQDFLDMPIIDDDEDDNSVAKKYPLHKQLKDMSEYKWKVGTLYVSREEFKDCATAYAVHTGRGLRFDKVDLWRVKLSKVFLNKIAENPKIKLSTLIKKAYSKWNVELTKSKAARVKQFALDELQETYIEQYQRLYDYCHELLRSNPGSTMKLQVERPPEFASERPKLGVNLRPKFQRLYVCLDACKKSFMVCRPIICLDGCFIKTPYGGQLFTTIGWDPNDQILPIAYAVVEAETKDTWTWFLTNLCDDFGYDKIRRCTFMSDQQKVLISTLTSTKSYFIDPSVSVSLAALVILVFELEKPIVSMFKDIRVYIMRRWADNRDQIIEYPREVLPRIKIKVEKQTDASGKWVSTYAGRDKYEMRFNVDNFVANYYKKATYYEFYQHEVYPVNGPNLWEKTQFDDVLPQIYRKPIGRPKLKRNKAANENPTKGGVSREGQNQKCSYCFARGHNKRTCPKKRKVAATTSANKVAGSTRRASRIISRIISSTISSTISSQASKQSQAASKKTTMSRPKRKSSANDVSFQQSQATSKKAKLTPSNNNSGQLKGATKHNNLKVLPSPSKHVSISQLKFMARTPPKAWKKM
ncbi:hypothetical protein Ahy_B03g065324 [Arachis hypogaea]|uniref:Uncharacterized protein n=1 Tax=Arachis hypogaea TaxID=3818 RepID=A0A445A1B6_ARAHY|nr:hypothetical protein Ahy_B03g065324 [Arachis hypogaea]